MKTKWPRKATLRQRTAARELLRRLHEKYPGRVLSTALFGSAARGDFTPDSDIDVLIVVDHINTELEWDIWGVASRVSLECDVILDPHVFSQTQWRWIRENRRTLWRNVEKDGIELKLRTKERARAAVA